LIDLLAKSQKIHKKPVNFLSSLAESSDPYAQSAYAFT